MKPHPSIYPPALLPAVSFIQLAFEASEAGFQPAFVTVVRYTAGGTARPGRDYADLPGGIDFAPGQTRATILVQP